MVKLYEALEEARGGGGWGHALQNKMGCLCKIILDCISCKINQLIPYMNQDLVQIERATQHYCFVLHQKRTEILKNMQKGRYMQSIAISTFLELFLFFFSGIYQTYISQLIAYFSYCVQHPIRSLKRSFYILNCLCAYLRQHYTN